MSETLGLGAIVLAAGSSRRAGPEINKLLVPFDDQPLVTHAVAAAVDAGCSPVIIVTGHEAQALRQTITRSRDRADGDVLRFAHNPEHLEGMGASIRCAANVLVAEGASPIGTFVVPGDMPHLRSHHLRVLAEAFFCGPRTGREENLETRICVPVRGDAHRHGHPVLFGSAHFAALADLEGDRGARSIIESHEADVVRVELDDPAIHFDVDDPR